VTSVAVRARPGTARLVVLALAALGPFLVLMALVHEGWPPLVHLDGAARDGRHRVALASPGFVLAMRTVSTLGTSGVYVVVGAVLVWHLLRVGLPRRAVFVAVTGVGGSLLNTSVKALVDRARPVLDDPVAHAAYSSFPSGHAQGVVVAAGVLLVVLPALRRRVALPAVVWVLLMGFSRVALGVHYVSDVLAGYLLAVAWLAACVAVVAPDGRERQA